MHDQPLDISDYLRWEEGLPHPQWDILSSWVESSYAHDQDAAWSSIVEQWLTRLGGALGNDYVIDESEWFVTLSSRRENLAATLLDHAEGCRELLLSGLPGVTSFDDYGQVVIILTRRIEDYYRYVAAFYEEGEYGGSGGMHIRAGYSHVVLWGKHLSTLKSALAHELTHVALEHLNMPAWLEEGLTQMFEVDAGGGRPLMMDEERARKHKGFWLKYGLEPFWRGEGYSRADEGQEVSYQLSEILVRFMVQESQPGWFGFGRDRRKRFLEFLKAAKQSDAGEAACREFLGYGLNDLVARFLGPGEWYVSPEL